LDGAVRICVARHPIFRSPMVAGAVSGLAAAVKREIAAIPALIDVPYTVKPVPRRRPGSSPTVELDPGLRLCRSLS